MPRYRLEHPDSSIDVVVGWDVPLSTFFANIIKPATDDIEDEVT